MHVKEENFYLTRSYPLLKIFSFFVYSFLYYISGESSSLKRKKIKIERSEEIITVLKKIGDLVGLSFTENVIKTLHLKFLQIQLFNLPLVEIQYNKIG